MKQIVSKPSPIKQVIGFFSVLFIIPSLLTPKGSYVEFAAHLFIILIGLVFFVVIFVLAYVSMGRGKILNKDASRYEKLSLSGLLASIPSAFFIVIVPAVNYMPETSHITHVPSEKGTFQNISCYLGLCKIELLDESGKLLEFSTFSSLPTSDDCYYFDSDTGNLGVVYLHNLYTCGEVNAYTGFKN